MLRSKTSKISSAPSEPAGVRAVTFVCLNAYPAFDSNCQKPIGGMETRSALLARSLKRMFSWNVSFLLGDFGQPRQQLVDGIKLIKHTPLFERIEQNVTRRFYKYRWRPVIHLDSRDIAFLWQFPIWLLFKFLPVHLVNRFWSRHPSDVVCCFGNNATSASVIADCYRAGIKTVLCVASDDDLSAEYRPDATGVNDYGTPNWMASYALTTADYVMTQTNHQQALLRERFARDGILLRNPVDIPADVKSGWLRREERDYVLWVGRTDDFHKRPRLLLDLATFCPDCRFVMIVNRTKPALFQELLNSHPSNVEIIESVPPADIWDYFRRARLFVSTSAYEGFPNTFLQAAVTGTPVASLEVDPEHMLSQGGCGLHAGADMDRLAQAVMRMWNDSRLADEYALAMLEYVREHHDLEKQTDRFASLLDEICHQPLEAKLNPWLTAPLQRFVPRPPRSGP